jgi:hypothetical protein
MISSFNIFSSKKFLRGANERQEQTKLVQSKQQCLFVSPGLQCADSSKSANNRHHWPWRPQCAAHLPPLWVEIARPLGVGSTGIAMAIKSIEAGRTDPAE